MEGTRLTRMSFYLLPESTNKRADLHEQTRKRKRQFYTNELTGVTDNLHERNKKYT